MNEPTIQTIDLVNQIKKEIKSSLEQLSALDINAPSNHTENGNITGPCSVLLTKASVLMSLMDLSRSTAAFEQVDRRVVAMVHAGEDMYRALSELSPKEAKDFTSPILKAWEAANGTPR